MITFSSNTTIEFKDEDMVEPFIMSLPLNSIQKRLLMEGEAVTDKLDESSFPGTANTVHVFQVIHKEEL